MSKSKSKILKKFMNKKRKKRKKNKVKSKFKKKISKVQTFKNHQNQYKITLNLLLYHPLNRQDKTLKNPNRPRQNKVTLSLF